MFPVLTHWLKLCNYLVNKHPQHLEVFTWTFYLKFLKPPHLQKLSLRNNFYIHIQHIHCMYLLRTIFECCLRCVGVVSSAGENKNSNDRPYSAAAVTMDNERDETRRPNVECVWGVFQIYSDCIFKYFFSQGGLSIWQSGSILWKLQTKCCSICAVLELHH